MDPDCGEASRILLQLETLKSTKTEIERQISALEAQLQEINLQHPNATVPNGSCPPVIPSVDSGYGHDLSPQMIYRYSRHLLLPAFGVQGIIIEVCVCMCIMYACICMYVCLYSTKFNPFFIYKIGV